MATNSLAELRDIHLPPPISIWLPAPGWFLLAIFIVVTCTLAGYFFYRYFKKQRAKKEALKILSQLEKQFKETGQSQTILAELSMLLRRLALFYFPREDIAGLYGNSWLAFLNKTGGTTLFTKKLEFLLSHAPYQKDVSVDLHEAFGICREWIKRVDCEAKL